MTRSFTPGPWHLRRRFPDGHNDHEYVVQHEGPGDAFQEVVVIPVGDEFQAPNQLADGRLMAAAPDMAEVLKAYEQWEADIFMDDRAWRGPDGESLSFPVLGGELYERLIEIQGMRNAVLAKARGEEGQT